MTTDHPGIYVNAIIAVGGAVWVLVSALIVYIWRSSMGRISKLEEKDETTIAKLLLNPVLTIQTHHLLCEGNWTRFTDRIVLLEENIGLKIEKAILEASRNGK
jgi:hypothetical protein